MRKTNKLIALVLIVLANFQPTAAMAVDISQASFILSGNVPAVFSVTVRGYPGEFDLGPNTTVVDRSIGILHFKYNIGVSAIEFSSDTVSGRLENAALANITFASGGDYIKAGAACTILDSAAGVGDHLNGTNALVQAPGSRTVKAAGAPATADMDCPLTMSWTTGAAMQAAGVYSMTVTVKMTSI